MKTRIKMRVTPEQSKKVQSIVFENGVHWASGKMVVKNTNKPYLYIEDFLRYGQKYNLFKKDECEEVDPELFIRTKGTCEEE
jgi:hypothetical protein